MKTWLLRPIEGAHPWTRWYDKAFGFVVRAYNEADARGFASTACGDEGPDAWRDPELSSCTRLTNEGDPGVVLRDYCAF